MRAGKLGSGKWYSLGLAVGLLGGLFQVTPAGATYPGPNTDLFIVESFSGPQGGSGAGLSRYDASGTFGGGGARCGDAGTGLTFDTTSRIWTGSSQLGRGSFITCIQQSGGGSIYFVPGDFSNAVEVTNFDGDHKDPAVSADGSRLLYASASIPDGETQICMVDLDGTNNTCFAAPNQTGSAWAPVWNPADDQQFVFVANSDADPDLYLYDLGTNTSGALTENDVADFGPDYSPDGTKIVFSSQVNGIDQLFWMTQADREPMQLTTDANNNYEPVYSPQGDYIAFTKQGTSPGSEGRVHLMPAAGGQATALTNQEAGSTYDHAEWGQETSGSCEPNCGPPFEERAFASFRLTKHLTAKGVLGSDQNFGDVCVSGQQVRIQRKKGSGWVNVRTATTTGQGSFSARIPDRPGTYRANVLENETGEEDAPVICGAATSRTVRHAH